MWGQRGLEQGYSHLVLVGRHYISVYSCSIQFWRPHRHISCHSHRTIPVPVCKLVRCTHRFQEGVGLCMGWACLGRESPALVWWGRLLAGWDSTQTGSRHHWGPGSWYSRMVPVGVLHTSLCTCIFLLVGRYIHTGTGIRPARSVPVSKPCLGTHTSSCHKSEEC